MKKKGLETFDIPVETCSSIALLSTSMRFHWKPFLFEADKNFRVSKCIIHTNDNLYMYMYLKLVICTFFLSNI